MLRSSRESLLMAAKGKSIEQIATDAILGGNTLHYMSYLTVCFSPHRTNTFVNKANAISLFNYKHEISLGKDDKTTRKK